jgi:hypothetical protein
MTHGNRVATSPNVSLAIWRSGSGDSHRLRVDSACDPRGEPSHHEGQSRSEAPSDAHVLAPPISRHLAGRQAGEAIPPRLNFSVGDELMGLLELDEPGHRRSPSGFIDRES